MARIGGRRTRTSLIQEVEATQESSVLRFEHGPTLTVGRHGWGLAKREGGAFDNAYTLVTAQSLPTRQSLAALRQFLPRIIPDLTPHALESLTLEPDSGNPSQLPMTFLKHSWVPMKRKSGCSTHSLPGAKSIGSNTSSTQPNRFRWRSKTWFKILIHSEHVLIPSNTRSVH